MLIPRVPSSSSPRKGLYNPKAFVTHAASLDQGCPHCPRFPTAASRRSLGRVSVPVWLIILSDQLWIAALVGHYPTNKLIQRGPLPRRPKSFSRRRHPVLAAVSSGCPRSQGRFPRVTHPSATHTRKCAFDLHVLSAPPAFVLSQDQTLRLNPQPPSQCQQATTRQPGRSRHLLYWPQANPPSSTHDTRVPRTPDNGPTRVFQKMHKRHQNAACTSPLHTTYLSKEQNTQSRTDRVPRRRPRRD